MCNTLLDTDSIIYYKHRDRPDPLASMRGDWIGMLADEVPAGWRLVKFISPAPKVYGLKFENDDGEIKYTVKAKGFVSAST